MAQQPAKWLVVYHWRVVVDDTVVLSVANPEPVHWSHPRLVKMYKFVRTSA